MFVRVCIMLLALVSLPAFAQDAGVSAPTATAVTASPTVSAPMPAEYTVLVGGALMVLAFYLRRFTTGWFHTQIGGTTIILLSTVLTSCAEAIQKHGLSKSVLVSAAGSAMLTYVAMSNVQKPAKKNKIQQPGETS